MVHHLVTRRSALGLTGAALASPALAEAWPTRSIRFIVAYPPGGGADVTGRLFAEHMWSGLGQRIVVENRSGASGQLGATSVARADPDGYTFLCAAISEISIAPATFRTMPYDPLVDFAPVALLGRWPQILVASPSLQANSLAELIALGKAQPDALKFGSFGNNTLNHVNGERLNHVAGIRALHVPYRGRGQMLIDVIGGQLSYTFDSPATTLEHIRSGRLKAIAVASEQRLPSAPQIPTMTEAGLPGFVVNSWIGLLAPARTPRPIVERMNAAAIAAMASPEISAAQQRSNTIAGGGTPESFGERIRTEIADYRRFVSELGIEPL